MSNYIIIRLNELNHYGVKGMRWGHRKQMPLVGRSRRSNPMSSQDILQKRAQRIARAKKAAIIGGSIAVAGLAIYGSKKLHDKKVLSLANAMAERGYGKGPNYFSTYKEARSNWNRDGFRGYKDMISDVIPYRHPSGYVSPRELKKMNIKAIDTKQNDYLNKMVDSYYRKKHTYTL